MDDKERGAIQGILDAAIYLKGPLFLPVSLYERLQEEGFDLSLAAPVEPIPRDRQ